MGGTGSSAEDGLLYQVDGPKKKNIFFQIYFEIYDDKNIIGSQNLAKGCISVEYARCPAPVVSQHN